LIRAMREDEAMVLGFQQGLLVYEHRMSKRDAACIASVKPAQAISGQLTSSDVTDALAFYESKAGQGFTESIIDRFKLPLGTETGTDYVMRYMTADQVLEMKEFVQKPVAQAHGGQDRAAEAGPRRRPAAADGGGAGMRTETAGVITPRGCPDPPTAKS
jgi:hypothetical protein